MSRIWGEEPSYEVIKAKNVSIDDWLRLQAVQREAFAGALDQHRSPEEIDTLVGWNEKSRFVTSHIDPNTEVGHRFNANNLYTSARVAIARHGHTPVGFMYVAHNVSGGGPPEGPHNDSVEARALRDAKRLSIIKNYLWIREAAVVPDYQQKGVGKHLATLALDGSLGLQPVATYFWPEETPFLQGVLEKVSFVATGEQPDHPYGPNRDEVQLVRMEAPSVRSVTKML